MKFYVPTRGRPDCPTPSTLIEHGVPCNDITLVIRSDEVELYEDPGYPVTVMPEGIEGLSATRQWIADVAPRFHCQIDDDITGFLEKLDTEKWKVIPLRVDRFKLLVSTFESWLRTEDVAAASTQDRVSLAHPTANGQYTDYTRIGQMMFINGSEVQKRGWRFDRVELYADQDMALQIVRDGYKTRVSNRFGHAMRPLRAPGGCSIYRDQDCINRAAAKLCRLHPDLIKLRFKQKGDLVIPSRVISWRKARQEGEAKRRSANKR